MTSEVVVMNREAVALAADSNVTIQSGAGDKVFHTNKIFSLSKIHPVGAMVYANASFMDAPWESLIKEFRAGLAARSFPRLREYAMSFLSYLRRHPTLSSRSLQHEFVRQRILGAFYYIRHEILDACEAILDAQGSLPEHVMRSVAAEVIRSVYAFLRKRRSLFSIPPDTLNVVNTRYRATLIECVDKVFGHLRFRGQVMSDLRAVGKLAPIVWDDDNAGLVIAGFGQNNLYPEMYEFEMHGIAGSRLIAHARRNVHLLGPVNACVMPFARSEMVVSFMEGVEPSYQAAVQDSVTEILRNYTTVVLDNVRGLSKARRLRIERRLGAKRVQDVAAQEYEKALERFRAENYWKPIMNVVSVMPKHEMAALAESLVSLQSLKHRTSMDLETVGGPIDVAIISKGDGLVWTKRKHYFDIKLNRAFEHNYMRR